MKLRILFSLVLAVLMTSAFTASASAMLNPRVGRFMQRDPAGYVDGANVYERVGSNPVTQSDSSGLEYSTIHGPYGPQWNDKKHVCEIHFTVDYSPNFYDYVNPFYSPTPSKDTYYPLKGVLKCECSKQGLQKLQSKGSAIFAAAQKQIATASGVENALSIISNNASSTMQEGVMAAGGMMIGGVLENVSGLNPGKSPRVKTVGSEGELDDLFNNLSKGGKPFKPKNTYNGEMVELPDGTIIGKRATSGSGGSTIDINPPKGKPIKVHVER